MGNRQDDRSSRMGSHSDGRQGSGLGPEGGVRDGRAREGGPPRLHRDDPGRAFDRNEDMGGSGWSGASGRGGYHPQEELGRQVGYPGQPASRPAQHGYDSHNEYGRYATEGGYAADREYANYGGYAGEGAHADHDYGGFLSEDRPGHVPNQRWSGGYGADRDREAERSGYQPSGPPSGRGFTGNDFGPPGYRGRPCGAAAGLGPRRFGNEVDRGGRMGGYAYGPAGGGGFHGSDLGMGAPDEDRGPHYGKGPKGYKRSDDRTRDDVCDAIAHQGYIDASDVEVKVADGIVTLSGTVAHRHEKRKLEHLVESCRGVHEVHNELRLKRSDASKDKPADKPEEGGDGSGTANGTQNGKTARA
jgi:hypothetical protein